jgi:hypothetical protein
MTRAFVPALLALLGVSAALSSAPDSIGFTYAAGSYRVAGAGVRGNATVFEGDTVETGEAPATLQLKRGARMWLTPGTRVKVSSQAAVLLSGAGRFQAAAPYSLEARAVRVVAARPDTVVRVAVDEQGGAVVAPLAGAVDVWNNRGVRVGALVEGTAVRFAEDPSRAGVRLSGCLSAAGREFTLTDDVTNVQVRLTGAGLEGEAGHVVSVSGRELDAAPGGMPVVRVTGVERQSSAGCASSAPAAKAPVLLAAARPSEAPGQLTGTRPTMLSLLVVEGDGAINNIRQRTAREPIVEVQDENHRPVAGALVLFALPRGGPGGTFPSGARTLSVTTDSQGRAQARGLQPNDVAGEFEIAVTASSAGLRAALAIRQRNALVAESAGSTQGQGTPASGGQPGAGTARTTPASGGTPGGHAGTVTGLSAGTKIAIISGIAATATVGGLAAGGVFSGSSEPPASR